MNKVGILTFHNSINYGSVLQAYALECAIESLGNSVEIVNYQQRNYAHLYDLFRQNCSGKDLAHNLMQLPFYRLLMSRQQAFLAFRSEQLRISAAKCSYGDSLVGLVDAYDCIVCGSDQIWNPNALDFDEAYFLPWVTFAKKIAYAVSLNGGMLDKLPNAAEIKKYILDFDVLSVREESGKQVLESFLDGKREVRVVLDPTLLHGAEVYRKIVAERSIPESYIFLYSVNFDQSVIDAAERLSERLQLPVFTLFTHAGRKKLLFRKGKLRLLRDNVGPMDFLSLIQNAACVVTNSFHGTAFSIIFNKEFYAIGRTNSSDATIRDERICSILELLGLQERFLSAAQAGSFSIAEKINYADANLRRAALAKESMNFLSVALVNGGVH